MRGALATASCLVLLLSIGAYAQEGSELPDFFKDEKRYASDPGLCREEHSSGQKDLRIINAAGIAGPDRVCTFLQLAPSKGSHSETAVSWLATAECLWEAGFSRADTFTLTFDENSGTLRVRSDTENRTGEALTSISEEDKEYLITLLSPFAVSGAEIPLFSGEYTPCTLGREMNK